MRQARLATLLGIGWLTRAALLPLPVAEAQILPLTVPKGKLRFDFSGAFQSYDWRWNDGHREEAAQPFETSSLDRNFVPGLGAIEDRVRRITGLPTANLTLGSSIASKLVTLGTLGIGGSVGVTSWLTVFATVPIVRVQVEPRFNIDSSTANVGVSPDNSAAITSLNTAVASLDQHLANGDYDTDPVKKALALSVQVRAADILGLLQTIAVGNFLPREGSAIGAALSSAIQTLQTDFSTLAVTDFGTLPSLPVQAVSGSQFEAYLEDPAGPIAGLPLTPVPEKISVGDIEIGGVVGLIDHFPTSQYGTGLRSAVETKVRLRTGQLANPNRFFDLPTGDGQPDVEVRWVNDLVAGRFGTRLAAGYSLQLSGTEDRRVAPGSQPIAPAATLATLTKNPGDVFRLTASPFFRLAPYLSLYGGIDYWRRGKDSYAYAAGQSPIAGADLNALAEGSAADAILFSAGLSYSHSGLNKYGVLKLPMDASFRYEKIMSSTRGILPDANVVRIDLRFYTHAFGK